MKNIIFISIACICMYANGFMAYYAIATRNYIGFFLFILFAALLQIMILDEFTVKNKMISELLLSIKHLTERLGKNGKE
jgi:hypothetical protein